MPMLTKPACIFFDAIDGSRDALSHEIRRYIHYNYALRENRILEKYFPSALNKSKHVLPPEMLEYIERNALKEPVYDSPVSAALITRVTEAQVFSGFIFMISTLLIASGYFREDADSPAGIRRQEKGNPI